MRRWEFSLAVLGWICLVAWLAAFYRGGGKNVFDYAQLSIREPLARGLILQFSDQEHAMWSGWWARDGGGYRLSTSTSPDILFRWAATEQSCELDIQAFPMLAAGQRQQLLYARINDAPWAGPVGITADGAYRIADVGPVAIGINVLTFWLPGAQRVNQVDERLLSLALRSLKLTCAKKK